MAFTANGTFVPWDPLRALKDNMCASCGKSGAHNKCSACGFAKYCNQECQRAAWKAHKDVCTRGYDGYISQVEQRSKQISSMLIKGDVEGMMAGYRDAISAARAFGDAEGLRHNLRALAHRCEESGQSANSTAHNAEADKIEKIIGKPLTAQHVFSQLDRQQVPPELEKLAARPRDPSHARRGAKSGSLPWCTWEQTISDMTLSVPLPADVPKRGVSVVFGRKHLKLSVAGGIVVADCDLFGAITPDECTWTHGDGVATLVLEKAERKVWDWLLPQPPAPPADAPAAPASTSGASSAAAEPPHDVSDPSAAPGAIGANALPLNRPLVTEPVIERLMDAVIAADLAPPRPSMPATQEARGRTSDDGSAAGAGDHETTGESASEAEGEPGAK